VITNSPIIRKRKNKLAVATTITDDSLLAEVLVVSMPIQSAHAVCVPSPNALRAACSGSSRTSSTNGCVMLTYYTIMCYNDDNDNSFR
jgi:hypothetical protein